MSVRAGEETQRAVRGRVHIEGRFLIQKSAILQADRQHGEGRDFVIHADTVKKCRLRLRAGAYIGLYIVRNVIGERGEENPGASRVETQSGGTSQSENLEILSANGAVHVSAAVLGDGGEHMKVLAGQVDLRISSPAVIEYKRVPGLEAQAKRAKQVRANGGVLGDAVTLGLLGEYGRAVDAGVIMIVLREADGR